MKWKLVYWISLTLIIKIEDATSNFNPRYPESYKIGELGRNSKTFPESDGNTGRCPLPTRLIGKFNFLTTPNLGNFIIGSADVLYMLNESSLECQSHYFWPTNENFTRCLGGEDNGCRNYLRVYQTLPSENRRLFLCGTQSGISPQCRILEISNRGFVPDSATTPVNITSSIISDFPGWNGIGEFRLDGTNPSNDITYFSAGVYDFDRSRTSFGRNFNISFHDIVYNNHTLSTMERLTVKNDHNWLQSPSVVVDYYRGDYGTNFQLYFVFLRERFVGPVENLYSRVVRLCRNDPGVNGVFSTFIKSRIYCTRRTEITREFRGSLDYEYNEITSMVFNNNGRINEDSDWVKMMYGAFSGPRAGPKGSALCVYPANSMGRNLGVFEVFREDVLRRNPDGSTTELENNYPECLPDGRPSPDFEDVSIFQDVLQHGEDPLLVLDGIIVTRMVVEEVCIVRRNLASQCLNQDVLFLGTDTGKILKVVFATINEFEIEPVIAEEISLGDNTSEVTNMVIKLINEVKTLFVSTPDKIYTLSLERCSRFQGCRDCIASRDPYCVWNNNSGTCENALGHLLANNSDIGSVPQEILQNIHTGEVYQCNGTNPSRSKQFIRVPSAPQNITISDVTNTTALITWTNAESRNFTHIISLTSSCPTANKQIYNISVSSYVLRNLCPFHNYYIAIRSTDTDFNLTSLYSDILELETLPGIPTPPRNIQTVINNSTKKLLITWSIPISQNSVITGYEVRWSFKDTSCTTNVPEVGSTTTTGPNTFMLTVDIPDSNIMSAYTCIRARTSVGEFSPWEQNIMPNGLYVPLSRQNDCSTLIIVACVAGIAVAASLLMSIILSVTICQNSWFS